MGEVLFHDLGGFAVFPRFVTQQQRGEVLSEMVARVADAIEHALFVEPAADLFEVARAAIAAMREPTEAVMDKGGVVMVDSFDDALERVFIAACKEFVQARRRNDTGEKFLTLTNSIQDAYPDKVEAIHERMGLNDETATAPREKDGG